MEGKVEDGVFDDFVIMVDSLEIMKSSLFDKIIFSVTLNGIEVRNFQRKDVKS